MNFIPTYTAGDLIQAAATLLGILAAAYFALRQLRKQDSDQRRADLINYYESIDPGEEGERHVQAWKLYYDILNGRFVLQVKTLEQENDEARYLDTFLHFFDSVGKMTKDDDENLEDLGLLRYDIMQFYRNCEVKKYIERQRECARKFGCRDNLHLYDAFQRLAIRLVEKYT